MYSLDDISNDALVEDFFTRGISKTTKTKYRTVLKHYCNWRKQLPEEFIEEADIEQNKNIKLKKRKIKKDLIAYINYLKDEEKKSPNTITAYLSCVKALYYDNDIVLPPRLPTGVDKDTIIKRGHDILPTLEDVRAIYDVAPIRDKAIFLLELSSGMGASETRHLVYSDFVKAFNLPITSQVDVKKDLEAIKDKEDEELIGCWNIFRYKTGWLFYTFNSPESTKAIIKYLEHRTRDNKPIESYNDPLFVTYKNERIGTTGFSLIYDRTNDKAGFGRRDTNNYRFITSHQLREIFSNSLFKCKIDKLRIDFFLGHVVNAQDSAYFRANVEDLKEDYIKALPEITLEKVKVKRIESEEFRTVIRELDAQKEENEKQREDIDFLKSVLSENPYLDILKDPGARKALEKHLNKKKASK